MAQTDNDLSIKQLFRVIFLQGGQIAIGTAIGMGVVLLVGIVGVFTAPLWLPIFAFMYWRSEKKKKAAGQDVSDLVAPVHASATPGVDADVTPAPEPVPHGRP